MRKLFIVPQDIAQGYAHLFTDSHWQSLPDGRVLLSASFHADHQQEKFHSIPGVEPLPHPQFESSKPISEDHAKALTHFGVTKGHTVHDVARLAGQINRSLKLW
jgi:hypothetical protein